MNNILKYVEEIFSAASRHIEVLLFVGFGVAAFFLLFNLLINPYAKHNRRAKRATKMMSRSLHLRKSVPVTRLRLPDEYYDGFQNYRNSKSRFPSELMVFQSKRQYVAGQILFWIYAVLCAALVTIDGIKNGMSTHFVTLLAGAVMSNFAAYTIAKASAFFKTVRARKIYKKFVRHLDISFGEHYFANEGSFLAQETCLDRDIDDTVAKIEFLKSSGVNAATAREVAMLLSQEKLNKPRTHEQQKKLNIALNGLLQTLSTSAQKQQQQGGGMTAQ